MTHQPSFPQAKPRWFESAGSRWCLTVAVGVLLALVARDSPELQQVLIGLLIAAVTWVGALFLIGGIGFLTELPDPARGDRIQPHPTPLDGPAKVAPRVAQS